jgi:hypothetical protein
MLFLKEKQNGIKQKGFKTMKRYKRSLLLSAAFMLIFTMVFIGNVKAEEINTNTYSYEWKADSLVIGRSQVEKSFYVPQNMKPYNFVISLKLRPSPTLVKELSSLSILVNNNKAYSIMLDKLDHSGILNVKVPDYFIYKGGNSIVVKGFLKSTRDKCEINDEVNWVTVEKTSSFSFNYSRTDSTAISGIFDGTYYCDGVKGEVGITLPDTLSASNYSQISSLSALIGFIHKNRETEVNIRTFRYSQLDKVDKETIVTGTAEQIKTFNKALLTEEQWKKAEESGYIAIRKIGIKNHFIVIASKEEELERFCRILENKSSLSQIEGKDYVLDNDKIVSEKEFDRNFSLHALGYGNASQAGSGTKEFNYYFTIPAKKTLTANSKIAFVYNYSSLADYNKGYVTAAVNSENLMSKNLAKDKVQDEIELTIREKDFDSTGFNISLKFNLRPEAENCTAQGYDDIWVAIDSLKSNFKLELQDRTKYSLLNSQGLLQALNGKLEGSIAVDSYNNLSPDSISKISSYLGKVSQGVNMLLIKESEDNANTSGAIIGLTDSPLIKTVKDKLRIPISDTGEFVNKDLFIQNTPSLGAIGLTLRDQRLVIAASDKTQLNSTIQNYLEAVSSKDIVILKDGKIIASFGEEPVTEGKASETIKRNYNMVYGLMVLLGASICIFILYYKKVK